MISLINHDPVRENSEVVIIYPDISINHLSVATGDFKSHLCKPRELERSGEP